MPTISISPNEHLKPRAHAPAGGPNLIASFKNDIVGQSATSFASSAKVMHGDEAITYAGVTTLYHGNQQYSVTALSDSSGNISERYAYTAYGQPTFLNASGTVQTTSAASNRYTFTGREWDSTLGLHHFRARCMSGMTGRFLTRDPIGYVDGRNLYANYLSIQKADPSGTKCCILYWGGVGLGTGTGPRSGSGHVALKCGSNPESYAWPNHFPGDYYSFGAGPTENFDRRLPSGRNPDRIECLDCDLDEAAIRKAWRNSLCDQPFRRVGHNCSTTLTQLIQAGIKTPCASMACPCETEYTCKDECAGRDYNNGPPGIDRPYTALLYFRCVKNLGCKPFKAWCRSTAFDPGPNNFGFY